jgi:hypothetical protein
MSVVLTQSAGLAYEVVRSSWVVSTVLLKQVLVLHLAKLALDEEMNLKHLEEVVLKYSRPTVASMVTLGFIVAITGFEITPAFPVYSELIALIYYGFLFWKF